MKDAILSMRGDCFMTKDILVLDALRWEYLREFHKHESLHSPHIFLMMNFTRRMWDLGETEHTLSGYWYKKGIIDGTGKRKPIDLVGHGLNQRIIYEETPYRFEKIWLTTKGWEYVEERLLNDARKIAAQSPLESNKNKEGQDSGHFLYPPEKREEIAKNYYKAKENGEIRNKETWAQNEWGITAKTLNRYCTEFPKNGT